MERARFAAAVFWAASVFSARGEGVALDDPGGVLQGRRPLRGDCAGESASAQPVPDVAGQFQVVFNNQRLHGVRHPCCILRK